MPHQCVKCGTLHGDTSNVILEGCTKCGSKVFFFVKQEQLDKARKRFELLNPSDRAQIETDVYDLMGDDIDREIPVVLDFESINILKPGKYELDLVNLFKKGTPVIYRLEDGKYVIDLVESFDRMKKK